MNALSRRAFLWGVAGLGASACAQIKPISVTNTKIGKLVVIGGGIAGLTVSRHLSQLAPALDIKLVESNAYYLMCPGSNEVISDLRKLKDLRHDYPKNDSSRGVERIRAEAIGLNPIKRLVMLNNQTSLPYDRLIVAPGVDFRWKAIEGYDESTSRIIPHAWKAGLQTLMLRRQLRAMPNGGVVIITVPANPYRCPPGPYERASLMAHFLKRYKPRSKIIILDGKSQFPKQSLFESAWKEQYPNLIEWIALTKEGNVERVDADQLTVHTEFGAHKADVLNIIPPQKAGKIALWMELTDESGWCPVHPLTFESTRIPGVHVIGDACSVSPMPKSAFASQSQARNCAAAVVDLLRGYPPAPP
ncbi:MAG: FAD-dependent oxidoreductase, partial [Methylococcaceae bacterium]